MTAPAYYPLTTRSHGDCPYCRGRGCSWALVGDAHYLMHLECQCYGDGGKRADDAVALAALLAERQAAEGGTVPDWAIKRHVENVSGTGMEDAAV